ncbi:3-phosphoshikimate 1-carboxyvinyltransferase [bacterium]|nr:3-phosphoshikimate 1-carboxyvinyltransferase [bacterium]
MKKNTIQVNLCTKPFNAELTIPGDKSISHRAVILSSIGKNVSKISNFLMSEDCLNTLNAFKKLGVLIDQTGECEFVVHGKGLNGLTPPKEEIYMGNSGTGMRLLSGLLASQPFTSVITGDESLSKRPMKRIITPLKQMGASITAVDECYPPLKIKGGCLRPIKYHTPMASAQVKSAILLAGLNINGATIIVEPAKSRDHTEHMLKYFGADIEVDGLQITLKGGNELINKDITVPGDISSAAFFIAAAAAMPGAELMLNNIGLNPTRIGIIKILKSMGAHINISLYPADSMDGWGEPRGNIVVEGTKLHGTTVSGADIPLVIDEIPIIAVAAALAEGSTVIQDAEELRVKESDRIKTMVTNLCAIGADVIEKDDGMIITGGSKLKGAEIQSFGDHRVAMSMAIAGLFTKDKPVKINDTKNIDTSFPGFEKYLNKLLT